MVTAAEPILILHKRVSLSWFLEPGSRHLTRRRLRIPSAEVLGLLPEVLGLLPKANGAEAAPLSAHRAMRLSRWRCSATPGPASQGLVAQLVRARA